MAKKGVVAIAGYTGTGKDSIFKIMKGMGFQPIISDATRYPRWYEQDGIDYNFISDDEYETRKATGYYIETTEFPVKTGVAPKDIAKYGTPKNTEFTLDKVIVVNPDGISQLDAIMDNVIVVYVVANDYVIRERLKTRGDKPEEIERRLSADKKDFEGMGTRADYLFFNNGKDLDQLELEIKEFIEQDLKPYIKVIE